MQPARLWRELSWPQERWPRCTLSPIQELIQDVIDPQPRVLFDTFATNLRSARRGAAGGPSSMTVEHLRILLDCERASHALYELQLVSRELMCHVRVHFHPNWDETVTFHPKNFHPKSLSSQNHFHPKPLSSKTIFIPHRKPQPQPHT